MDIDNPPTQADLEEEQHHQEYLDKRKILEYKHYMYPEVNKKTKDFETRENSNTET